ncbi:hypothetical protein [Neobacillus niacini]|uniref:hypothetical protein n=1 Tax=Neobacillus niacini TaxID=86668 RepID=UPI0021CB2CCF|nr:hypothetical protein [Neobacillus niacini]MCM3764511.1 hypothetical protein [Neobacillus niacini]
MPKHEKNQDVVEQPLMSTGTPEPGFKVDSEKSEPVSPPKIGDTVIGDEVNES